MDHIYFSMFFSIEHFNHFRKQLFCFVCSGLSIPIRYSGSLLFTNCHTMEMIRPQGHFFLEADKLISLIHAGSSLKATHSLFPPSSLLFPPSSSLSTAFSLLWLLHWSSIFKRFFSPIRIPVSSCFSKQERLWITSPSLCDAPQSPWMLGSL